MMGIHLVLASLLIASFAAAAEKTKLWEETAHSLRIGFAQAPDQKEKIKLVIHARKEANN